MIEASYTDASRTAVRVILGPGDHLGGATGPCVVIAGPGSAEHDALGAAGVTIADFAPPPAPVPQIVSRFQARAALMAAGKLDAVQAAVDASGDPLIALAWAEAVEFNRQSPTIAALAGALGLTEAEIDDLFVQAATISA